jgi:hypothetical protein
MKKLQELTKEINEMTLKIEQEYPELYRNLDEIPITISQSDHINLTLENFSDYLDSLKQILKHHIEVHKNKKNKK